MVFASNSWFIQVGFRLPNDLKTSVHQFSFDVVPSTRVRNLEANQGLGSLKIPLPVTSPLIWSNSNETHMVNMEKVQQRALTIDYNDRAPDYCNLLMTASTCPTGSR